MERRKGKWEGEWMALNDETKDMVRIRESVFLTLSESLLQRRHEQYCI